ncbi:gas vesicle protein GvpM [Halosolutus gelatinilyticus]|uniref:gas vesicle protein GvpM n=1 Tax=Halosolutus gelatinilyticus TaxID=2931975 RepID=UPI001FF21C5E|nr:gas vesicle protein GvpJ [Halosolutus gelatinilyticus]
MRPRKDDETFVDVIDVLLRDGVVVRADVIVSIAEIPLVGIKLTALIAGMETMNEYGVFEEWDARRRHRAIARSRSEAEPDDDHPAVESLDRLTVGHRNGDADYETDDDETNREEE